MRPIALLLLLVPLLSAALIAGEQGEALAQPTALVR